MPNLTNNMTGQKLIEEVNHSIDERGKNGVDGAAQEINSDLKINGKLQVGNAEGQDGQFISDKIVIPEIYLNNNISLKEFLNNVNNFLLSDANIVRDYNTGKEVTSMIRLAAFKFLDSKAFTGYPELPIRYNKKYTFDIPEEINISSILTKYDYIFSGNIDVVIRVYDGHAKVNGSVNYKLYKDNIVIQEGTETVSRSGLSSKAGEYYTYYKLASFNFNEIYNVNPNGKYSIEIETDITLDKYSNYETGAHYAFFIGTLIDTSDYDHYDSTPPYSPIGLWYNYALKYVEPILIE